MTAILTASTKFGWSSVEDRYAFIREALLKHGNDPNLLKPMGDVDTQAPRAIAWIDHGRWLAMCPDAGCRPPGGTTPGIEYVEPGEPFWCCACANVSVGHRWHVIAWPRKRAAIEASLLRRPYPHQRTWLPTETLADIAKETERILSPVSV